MPWFQLGVLALLGLIFWQLVHIGGLIARIINKGR